MKSLKVLSVGDNPLTSTGYGTVWGNLIPRWVNEKPDWEFYHLGWQSRDRAHKTIDGYTMLPMGNLEYGFDIIESYIMEYKPDILVTLCDVGFQSGYIEPINKCRQQGWTGKWVCYTPVDTHGWAITWNRDLGSCDVNVAMSKFGEQQMSKFGIENVKMIPHGVDLETYRPLDERDKLKQKYKVDGNFVVGFIGRNQIRKMIDRLVLAFANFAQDKEDVKLLLHTDELPTQNGWNINYLLPSLRIDGKTKLTKKKMDVLKRQTISPEKINELYNVMDVFGYATGGEGFGLPGIECQSAGTPLLMTDCSTALDLCQEENKIPVLKDKYDRNMKFIGTNAVYFLYPDDRALAELLNEKYAKWKSGELDEERKVARKFAEQYDWGPIAKQWIKLFEDEGS